MLDTVITSRINCKHLEQEAGLQDLSEILLDSIIV